MRIQPRITTDTEVLVIGSGAAGLRTALDLAGAGVDVTVVSRAALSDSATDWAQGGLAAVHLPDDSCLSHINDTLAAGAGLCDPVAVTRLVEEAPGAIVRLVEDGAVFDRQPDGEPDLHLEGGHHARRIWHADGDRSGHEVERALCAVAETAAASAAGPLDSGRRAAGRRLHLLTGTRAVDLLRSAGGQVCGARLRAPGGTVEMTARAVVLATGGIGRLWSTTTNPPMATGDGLVLGMAAGAAGRDLEFMQFHPTVLAPLDGRRLHDGRQVLVSEAVRGEGAVLVDAAGHRVMAGIHPLEDLAPRDVVSAAEHAHMARTGTDRVFLDAIGFGASRWERSFPSILAMCRELGVDPVTEPIPVLPGAHYHCGGLAADMDGRTGVPGLLAVGEVACTGVQGANRLASNSITEGLVAGARAARLLAAELPPAARPAASDPRALLAASLDEVATIMSRDVGLLRDAGGLARAHELLTAPAPVAATTADADLADAVLDAAHARLVGAAVALAAAARPESRGCHRRSDAEETLPSLTRHIDVVLSDSSPTILTAATKAKAA